MEAASAAGAARRVRKHMPAMNSLIVRNPLVLLGVLLAAFAVPLGAVEVGDKAPAWELNDLKGEKVISGKFKDKVVVLNFWATSCLPCVAEIPDFIKVQKEYEEQDVVFVGVSLDWGDGNVEKVQKFYQDKKMNYLVVMGDEEYEIVKKYGGIKGIPTTFVIGKDGLVKSKDYGKLSRVKLLARIKPLL